MAGPHCLARCVLFVAVQLHMIAGNWDCFSFLSCQDFFLAWFPDTIYIVYLYIYAVFCFGAFQLHMIAGNWDCFPFLSCQAFSWPGSLTPYILYIYKN